MKLNGVESNGNKLVVKEAGIAPRTNYSNNTFIKSSNLLKPLPNIPPPKPVNPTRSNTHQPLIQNIVKSYSDEFMPNKNKIILLVDSMLTGMIIEDRNSKLKGRGKIHLKIFREQSQITRSNWR